MIWEVWDKPLVDLFATRDNKKLPLYVSPFPDKEAWAVDALSLDWSNLYAYAYPPTAILGKVLRKIRDTDCEIVLVAPAWPKQEWFASILELLVDIPLVLPCWGKLLKQPRSGIFHQHPETFLLHAWKLSSNPMKVRAFQKGRLVKWHELKKHQL